MVDNKSNPVTSAAKVRRHRFLKKKREEATEHGVQVHTDLIVLQHPDGYIEYRRLTEDGWEKVEFRS